MASSDDWLPLAIVGGAVLLLSQPREPVAAPSTGYRMPSGQWGLNVPGYGQVVSGPGGTFVSLDPRVFQMFGTGGQSPVAPPPVQPVYTPPQEEYASPVHEVWEDPCVVDPFWCTSSWEFF